MARASNRLKREKFADNLSTGVAQEEEADATIDSEMEKMKPNSPGKTGCGEMEFVMQEKKMSFINYQIDLFWNLVKEIEQRKMNLETKLLELYGLKEQKSYITELQRKLEKMAEKNKLNVKLNLLQEERNDLQKEIKDGILAKEQLETANKMVEKMKRKLDANANHTKGHLMMLQEILSGFQSDQLCCTDTLVEEKHKAVKYFELQLFEMKRKNKELELEKRELAVKLNAARVRMTTLSNCTEQSKTMAKAGDGIRTLKQANQDLSNQVERLQQNRFGMVEELVYQRWLNTSLRFEIQDHESLSRKLSKHDIGTNSNHKSLEKSKRLILNPNFDSFSSHSFSTESDKNDSSTSRSSSSSQRSTSEKSSSIHNIRSWGRCQVESKAEAAQERFSGGSPWGQNGLISRLSSLMVPSKPSMLCGKNDSANNTPTKKKKIQDLTKSVETPSLPLVRRVSFSDSATTDASTLHDMPNKVEEILQNKEMRLRTAIKPSTKTRAELVEEKQQLSSGETNVAESDSCIDVIEQPAKRDSVDIKLDKTRIGSDSKTHMVLDRENYKVEINIVHLIALIFLFCFILLGYFLPLSAGIYKA